MKKKLVSFVILCSLILMPTLASAANDNYVTGFTPGRSWATFDMGVGVITAILAGLSLRRSIRVIGNRGRNGAIAAMILGLIVVAYACVHVTIFPGAPGTGDGRVGAVVAIIMGLISMVLAGLTLVRSRRTG